MGKTLIAYVDESGDPGKAKGSSQSFTLGALLIDADRWQPIDVDVQEFRRYLNQRFGLPPSVEIKSKTLIRNTQVSREYLLQPNDRRLIYKAHFDFLRANNIATFSIVGHKALKQSVQDSYELVWKKLFEQIQHCESFSGFTNFLLFHDEGENRLIKKIAREARLNARKQNLPIKAIEDPVARDSHHSHFIQFADLVAYSSWRAFYQPAKAVADIAPGSLLMSLDNKHVFEIQI